MKPCNDLIVHRRRDGFSQTSSSPSVWRQFRSPPSRSQTRLACIHVSSHRTCEPPSCACVAPSSYPASLIVSADVAIRAACPTGSRRTRRPRLRRPPLFTYELGRNRREPRFRAARRDRVACVVAAPRRPPGALLLLLLVRQVLPLSLWAARSGEPVLARPTGCDGRVGSRGRLCEAALGDAGSHRTSSGVYYKLCHRCKRPCEVVLRSSARGSMMSRGSGSSCLGSIEAARCAGGHS